MEISPLALTFIVLIVRIGWHEVARIHSMLAHRDRQIDAQTQRLQQLERRLNFIAQRLDIDFDAIQAAQQAEAIATKERLLEESLWNRTRRTLKHSDD